MCCGTEKNQGKYCGCSVHSEYIPRFMTKDQKITNLKKYLSGLKDEAKAVEEHIAMIQTEK